MGYVKCCEHNRKAKSFQIAPESGYTNCIMHVLDVCRECNNYIVELHRTKASGAVDVIRRIEDEALKLFYKLRDSGSILYEIKPDNIICGKFYLPYGEYGAVKKCYSNLSTMKMGLTDNSVGFEDKLKEQSYLKAVV